MEPIFFSSRRRSGARIGGFAALALISQAAFAAAAPAPLLNQYNLTGTANPEATLSSYVSCGSVRCDIGYTIATQVVDRFVRVAWKDTSGAVLIGTTNQSLLGNFYAPAFFGGSINATEWRYGVIGSGAFPIPPSQAVGTADFTGTGSGPDPCGVGYVCNDADYYFWPPSVFSVPSGGASAGRLAAAGAATLGTISGTLANVGVNPADPTDIGDRRFDFLQFASSVAFDGASYVYRYAVSNFTDLTIPFAWAAAGMAGELAPMGSAEREAISASPPGVISSAPGWTLRTTPPFLTQDYSASLPIYAPVPEAQEWLLLFAGLVLLAATRRARRSHAPGVSYA